MTYRKILEEELVELLRALPAPEFTSEDLRVQCRKIAADPDRVRRRLLLAKWVDRAGVRRHGNGRPWQVFARTAEAPA